MAIQYNDTQVQDRQKEGRDLSITISNGHKDKLDQITTEYGMKNDLHTLAFLLDVAEQSKGSGLSIDGSTYIPAPEMKK